MSDERRDEVPWTDEWGNEGTEFTIVGEQPPRYCIQVVNPEGQFVVGVKSNGTAEFGPGFKAPWHRRRASRQFWKQVARLCGMSEPLRAGIADTETPRADD